MSTFRTGVLALALSIAPLAQALPLHIVKDVNPGSASGFTRGHVVDNGDHVLFWASDPISAPVGSLWRSDGTEAGTIAVEALAGSAGSFRSFYPGFDGQAFFELIDGFSGFEQVWRSDGTAAGTYAITTTDLKLLGVGPSAFHAAAPYLWFDGKHPSTGRRALWRSDGTVVATAPAPSNNTSSSFHVMGDRVAFYGNPDGVVSGVAISDGTVVGSVTLAQTFTFAQFQLAEQANGRLFFTASHTATGIELWRINDGSLDSAPVKDISPGMASSSPENLLRVDDRVFFTALEPTAGRELWVSDGTEAGTVRVKDVRPGLQDSNICCLFDLAGTLLFFADDGVHGKELWRSDGTDAGTWMVKDTALNGDAALFPVGVVQGDAFYFRSGSSLWRSDGTEEGTSRVAGNVTLGLETKPIAAVGRIFTQVGGAGSELGALDVIEQYGQAWCSTAEVPIRDTAVGSQRIHLPPGTPAFAFEVALDLYHTYPNDLVVRLTHLDTGSTALLLDRPTTAGNQACVADLIDVRFVDGAPSSATTCATGSQRLAFPRDALVGAAQPLSAFAGEDFGGTWELTWTDGAAGDRGQLHRWCLYGVGADVFSDGFEE